MRILFIVIPTFFLTYVCDAAEAQTLVAKLAGQSLKAQVTYNISIRNSYGLPLSTNVTLDLRVYFSSKGRLFNYFGGQQASGGSYADKRIVTPDVPMHDPEMGVEATWHTGTNDLTRTIDFGNLRQIYRVNISGIAPSLSCEVLFVFNKKGNGPYYITNMETKKPVEFVEYKLQSKSCIIKSDNIFSPGDL